MDIFGAALIGVSGLVLVVVGVLQGRGRLPRNHLLGLRTTETLRGDAAWHAAHHATSNIVTAAGVPPILAAAVMATRSPDEPWLALIVVGSLGVMMAMIVVAGVRAHRIARDVNDVAAIDTARGQT